MFYEFIYRKTQFKQVVICIQFPRDYPKSLILIELKSKTFSDQLLKKLTDICEEEAKKHSGRPQVTSNIYCYF